MSKLPKLIALMLTLIIIGCSNSETKTEKVETGSASPPANAAAEKTEEMKLIDREMERITLNPQTPYEYCESKNSLSTLERLANTQQGKDYAEEKQRNSLEILRRSLDDITKREAIMYIDKQQIHDAAFNPMWSAYRGWNIVKTEELSTSESNNDGVFTMSTRYRYTIRKSGGLFKSDDYDIREGVGTAKYIFRCKGEPNITYSGKVIDKK